MAMASSSRTTTNYQWVVKQATNKWGIGPDRIVDLSWICWISKRYVPIGISAIPVLCPCILYRYQPTFPLFGRPFVITQKSNNGFKQFQTSKQSSTQSSTISLHPSTSYIFIIYPPLFKDGNGQFPIKFCFFKKMMKFLKKFKLQGFKPFTNYFWVAIRMIKSRASCRVKRSFTVRCKVRTSHARKV